MWNYIWRKVNVWFGKETTRGTPVAIAWRNPKASFDFEDKSEKVIDESSIGVIEDSFDGHVSKQRAEWSFETNVYANVIWWLLLNVFWEVSSTWSGTQYTHEFSVAENNQHNSLTIGVADETQDRQFPLAMVNSLELSAEVGDFVKASVDFRSKKGVNATLTPSYWNDFALLWKNVLIYLANDLAGLDSADPIKATNFSLTINKNLEDADVLWSVEPEDICNTMFWVEGNIELLRDELQYKNLYMEWTKQAMRIAIIDTNTDLWSANPSLTIDLASVIMTEFAKTQDNDALIRQGFDFKALYSMADSKMITAKLVNSQATY